MKKAYDKSESLTKMLVEYHREYYGRTGRKRTFYSFIKYDEKSKNHGIVQLRKYAEKNIDKINYAAIYDNISGELIETIIKNGKRV